MIRDLFYSKKLQYSALGIGIFGMGLIIGKALYDYSMYTNLKYVKNQLKSINYKND